MAKKRPKNIFDEASKKPSKGKKKKKVKKPRTPMAMQLTDQLKLRGDYEDPELSQMMKRIREIDVDLKDKIQNLCQLSGRTPKEVESFLGDQKNFTENFLKDNQKKEDILIEQLWGKKIAKVKKVRKKKKETKLSDKRKKKSIGARKKWIPMD